MEPSRMPRMAESPGDQRRSWPDSVWSPVASAGLQHPRRTTQIPQTALAAAGPHHISSSSWSPVACPGLQYSPEISTNPGHDHTSNSIWSPVACPEWQYPPGISTDPGHDHISNSTWSPVSCPGLQQGTCFCGVSVYPKQLQTHPLGRFRIS